MNDYQLRTEIHARLQEAENERTELRDAKQTIHRLTRELEEARAMIGRLDKIVFDTRAEHQRAMIHIVGPLCTSCKGPLSENDVLDGDICRYCGKEAGFKATLRRGIGQFDSFVAGRDKLQEELDTTVRHKNELETAYSILVQDVALVQNPEARDCIQSGEGRKLCDFVLRVEANHNDMVSLARYGMEAHTYTPEGTAIKAKLQTSEAAYNSCIEEKNAAVAARDIAVAQTQSVGWQITSLWLDDRKHTRTLIEKAREAANILRQGMSISNRDTAVELLSNLYELAPVNEDRAERAELADMLLSWLESDAGTPIVSAWEGVGGHYAVVTMTGNGNRLGLPTQTGPYAIPVLKFDTRIRALQNALLDARRHFGGKNA